MPTVSLTPQQQATIDAANKVLAQAKSALDSATSSANDYLAALNRCYCGKGHTTVYGGKCAPLDSKVTFPNLASPDNCHHAADINTLITDCGEQTTCKQRVSDYNDRIATYNAALANYKTAKDNLQATLDAISKDPTVAANTDIINNQINAQKSKDMIKWLFFGLTAVIIIGAAIFIGLKILGGRSTV